MLRPSLTMICLLQSLLLCWAVPAASTASSASSPVKLPEFLSHVDQSAIDAAKSVAKRRHDHAIKLALEDYNTDTVPGEVDFEALSKIHFKKIDIQAPGALPDFCDELERSIHVTEPPLLSQEECASVIKDAEDYAGGEWGMLPSGQYEISGYWVKDIPAVREWFTKMCRQRMFPLFQRLYPDFVEHAVDMCVESAYLFKYTPETGRRTDVHIDCGCLSFTIALNGRDEYEGGGTWFEGLQQEGGGNVLFMDQGQVTLRPGGVRHAGCATEKGARYIIGGFLMNRAKVETVRMLLNKDADTTASQQQSLLEAAIVLNPACDTPYNLLANQIEQAGDKTKARQILECGLSHAHPGAGELAYPLGSLYFEEQDYTKTLECMKICLDMDDHDIDALTMLASAYAGLNDADNERTCYERIIAAPAAARNRVAAAYCNLGVLSEGNDAEFEYYKRSLEIDPDCFAPYFSLGAAYANREQWKDAVDALVGSAQAAENDEDRIAAVQSLYRAAVQLIQKSAGGTPPPTSREALIEKIQDVMGVDNYQLLTSSMQR